MNTKIVAGEKIERGDCLQIDFNQSSREYWVLTISESRAIGWSMINCNIEHEFTGYDISWRSGDRVAAYFMANRFGAK